MAKNKKKGSFFWLMGVSLVAVGLLLFCQFYFGDGINENTTFYENTNINGINVSGMTQSEAENVISDMMLKNRDKIELKLKLDDKDWLLKGGDFEVKNSIAEPLSKVMAYGHQGNIFSKKKLENKIKKEGLNVNLSYANVLGGMDEKLNQIIDEVESKGKSASVVFNPDSEEMFSLSDAAYSAIVDRDKLFSLIDESLVNASACEVEIPIAEILPLADKETLLSEIGLRSSFKTSYATSSADRKFNVKKALSSFNGMIVEPGQEVSFNACTGARTTENGYKNANIILNGVYVSGTGGGVCQASTTLYNALLLADIEILQVNHHSLPASYVPLSFDAMVSEGYSDLVFKNTLDCPIYIKAYGDENNAVVEIYGQKFDDGKSIRTRAEFVRVLPHDGDKIIADNGEYSKYVLYKGEYYRVKYPREGYESKGYLEYLENGEVTDSKMIRHDYYYPQSGIVVEGNESLGEGMSVPPSDVKLIPAQKVTKESAEKVKNKLEKTNPSEYNP